MKKIICLLMAVLMCVSVSSCKKKKSVNDGKAPVSQSEQNNKEENKQNDKDTQKEKDNLSKNEEKNNGKDTSEKNNSSSENTVSATGMFLGQDDANFAVVFMKDDAGNPKDIHFKIGDGVSFDSVEIGSPVKIEYTTDSTDTKVLTKITPAS